MGPHYLDEFGLRHLATSHLIHPIKEELNFVISAEHIPSD